MAKWNESTFTTLQKVGKSLMTPVSVLPAAGLLVALGRVMQSSSASSSSPVVKALADVFYSGGIAIFEQLPAVFAIGVAIGFTGGAGVAGLASVVGYFTLINVLKVMSAALGLKLAINTGVFGGIIIGLMSSYLYNKFHKTQLHSVLGFFSGKRLVPIITAAAAIVLGIALGFIWPPIQAAINSFGSYVMSSSLGPAFYAAGKRLLIPVGLHHVYYPPFLFQFGDFVTEAGKVLHGESARYFAGDHTAGLFMASEYPIMLFGLPAAAFAMYLRAPKEKRVAVGGIMLSAALTSIITGITEPIEFAFIFVAPLLYVLHVAFAFCSGLLVSFFDIHLGYTFSASLIDYVIGFFNQQNSSMLWLVIGPIIGVLYFVSFYSLIKIFDFKTPGREDDSQEEQDQDLLSSNSASQLKNLNFDQKAYKVLEALGGDKNLSELDACITRLRVTVIESSLVNIKTLKALGAAGVMSAGNNIQVIFGTQSDALKDQIKDIINNPDLALKQINSQNAQELVKPITTNLADNTGKHEKKSDDLNTQLDNIASPNLGNILAPIEGRILSLDQVPDPTFSEKILGDGIAIEPTKGEVRSPVNGKILQVFHTKHAIGILSDSGIEILIHVGLETVKMNGDGFKSFVENNQEVKRGDLLLKFDLEKVRAQAKSTISPILFTNMNKVDNINILANNFVKAGEEFINITLRQ